ncbi:MAG TPA: hypothetical protein VGJ81_10455 [Thermoanaerobaculia bacterium]|jgi:DNA-binding Lrp family transcriptional regulator
MKDLLERIVLLAMSQELDVLALEPTSETRPSDYLPKAIERVRPLLSAVGIPSEKIEQVISEADVGSVFTLSLVPNPVYWSQYLHRHVRFYLVHSRPSRFHELLEYLEKSNVSYATCYGDTDFVIRISATEDQAREFEKKLDDIGVTSTVLSVVTVPYYLGHEELRPVSRSSLDAQYVDRILSQSADRASDDEVRRLVGDGLVVGVVVRENHLQTGRLRAFVTISLRELSAVAKAALERKLIAFNKDAQAGHGMPVVALYRLQGRPQYLLELICDDQAQLDSVTVRLLTVDHSIENTETLVVARYVVAKERYSTTDIALDERRRQMKKVVDQVLRPISDELLAQVSELHASQFADLEPYLQLRVLNLYQELTVDSLYLTSYSANPLYAAVIELVTGLIEQNASRVTNAGVTVIRDHVERANLALASYVTDSIFGGDAQKWQSVLKASDSNWRKWGLRVWGERIYPAWNGHALLQHVFKVESGIIDSLRILGDLRNSLAHFRDADLAEVIHTVREVFNRSYKVLRWLEEATESIHDPMAQFRAAAAAISAGRHGRELALLQDMKSFSVDLRNIDSAVSQDDDHVPSILGELRELDQGDLELNGSLLERVGESVVPLLAPSEHDAALALLEALSGSIGSIPSGLASCLLAGIVAKAVKVVSY